jgi:hypothetical protein
LLAAFIASAGCGKKGPPLPPIVHVPAGVEKVEARRQGDSVTVTVTVPAKNIDGSVPVDIGRIDVYGYTGTNAPPRARFLEVGTLIGSITVPPQNPDAPSAAVEPGGPVPGGPATIIEVLTPDALVATPLPPAPATTRQPPPIGPVTPPEPGPLRRFYLALPFSPRGRLGPPGMVGELRLTELPDPPLGVTASVFADVVRIEWEPSGGLIGFLLDRPLAPELSPLDNPPASTVSAAAAPDGPTRYNVYREIVPLEEETARVSQPAAPDQPAPPINPSALEALNFADPLTGLDGRERCYVIRSVRGQGGQTIEGLPSSRTCITPTDDVAPEAPSGLTVDASDGAIRLVWVPNAEPDVAGYLILRGEAGDATLTPVTDTVVTEARYSDRTVKPGVRYVYAVQAIDTRLPRPNVSAESARVEALAR